MNKLNKDETKKYIIKIFNFIENGDSKFKGHPGLYFFHTKKELEEKIKELLNKEEYDELDIDYDSYIEVVDESEIKTIEILDEQ